MPQHKRPWKKHCDDKTGYCVAKFKVSPSFHKECRRLPEKMVEHGGTMKTDRANGNIVKSKSRTDNIYDRVNLPYGEIQYHSHPGECLNDEKCAIGIPSPVDMSGFVQEASVRGTLAHLVYSKEGTYMIRIKPKVLAMLRKHPKLRKEFRKRVIKKYERMHDVFAEGDENYTDYRRRWLAAVNNDGFSVKLFKGKRTPSTSIEWKQRKAKK